MKIFKRKHFQALIYSIFLSLPLLSVLGRCVYTIVNKNAKDSYYGENINNAEYTPISSFSDNLLDKKLYFDIKTSVTAPSSSNGGNSKFLYFDNLEIIANNSAGDSTNAKGIAFYIATSGNIINAWWLYEDNTLSSGFNSSSSVIFTCNYLGNDLPNATLQWLLDNEVFKYVTYNDYSYLDNAFEYSIDRFVSENEYGELDFFTWFSSLFLSGNSLDSLYIHFINWYMNYILYVSLGYLIFSVLLWFVNFFRRLVDDTQNINVGGM